MVDYKKYLDKSMRAKITKETFAIWELGFREGYQACIEDAGDEERIVEPTSDANMELKEKIKKENTDIVKIIDVFREFNPGVQYGHKGHRTAIQELLKTYGMEQLLDIIKSSREVQGQPYAPVITNPTELLYKVVKLETFLNK